MSGHSRLSQSVPRNPSLPHIGHTTARAVGARVRARTTANSSRQGLQGTGACMLTGRLESRRWSKRAYSSTAQPVSIQLLQHSQLCERDRRVAQNADGAYAFRLAA
jgi:hypothetical protein